jgi:NAD(P)-dependent dehydrogenase (short-subunit alcohol dehydrogenase family)
MTQLDGKVAAITGAASGIGEALALEFAEAGCDLAISDIDEQGLADTALRARSLGAETHHRRVDVSSREALEQWAEDVVEALGGVHIVVNNAGVSVSASLESVDWEDFEWLMDINFWGVVYGTRAFLPHLRDSGDGHIVNLSSIFGLIAAPTQGSYCATKFAVRGYTETLRAEMKLADEPIQVSCVHPGGVRTNIARSARYGDVSMLGQDPEAMMEAFETSMASTAPEEAARQIVEGIRANEPRIVIGKDARIFDAVQRLFPERYVDWVSNVLRGDWLF